MIQWLINQVQNLFMENELHGRYCDLSAYYEHQFLPQKAYMTKPVKKSASEYSRQFRNF